MTLLSTKMTLQQERTAYKRAVSGCLVAFFSRSKKTAEELVEDWWTDLQESRAYKTGLFMHDAPINTAADLVGVAQPPSIREPGERYDIVLANALPKPRKQKKRPASSEVRRRHAA